MTAILILLLSFLIYWLIPLPHPLFHPDYSTLITDQQGGNLRVFLNSDEQWLLPPDPNAAIPAKLQEAVLCFEDKHFFGHGGIDFLALFRAVRQNLTAGHVVSGASTITMQVARLADPKRRTLGSKLLEFLQSTKIELQYSKREILRMYLDHAPYGGNIIGIRAAALRYFGKEPHQLTWGEAATLAVLPNAPGLISPDLDRRQLLQKRNRLLQRLHTANHIDNETLAIAITEPLPGRSQPFAFDAPHLARDLRRKRPNGGVVKTTINLVLQRRVQELAHYHSVRLAHQGITAAAVVVAETGSGKVRAYIGAPDWSNSAALGQIDGVVAPRSSGSILKPFLFARAIDEGLILPATWLRDVPSYFGSFSPRNASESFDGIVPASEALIRSLNVPAVRLLNTYGIYPFYSFLQNSGLTTLHRTADDYGLPLILGGAEVRLLEMAAMYRALGNGGRFSPLIIADDDAGNAGGDFAPLLSEMACYQTLEMLRNLRRPGAEFYWEQYQSAWPIAWKTGTSYGHRDAWAIGVSPQWTIAVWAGNFDGTGNPNLGGARSAGPLLFDIFNTLPRDPQMRWFEAAHSEIRLIDACSESGFVATAECPEPILAEAPVYAKPMRLCPFHRRIFVSRNGRERVCSSCWEPGEYEAASAVLFSPEVNQQLIRSGKMVSGIPPHRVSCSSQREDISPIEIVYPRAMSKVWIPVDFGGVEQKITMRVAHQDTDREVYWYVDDQFYGSTRYHHEKAVNLSFGWHRVEVVDEIGYRDSRKFYVSSKR